MIESKPLYVINTTPMHVIVFASGGGGNLQAAIDISKQYPELIKIGLVVTDRLGIPAIGIAEKNQVAVIAKDFEKECGIWSKCKDDSKKAADYRTKSIQFHDAILAEIIAMENKLKYPFDFVVLSYHRWIYGSLFNYFEGRMINQHAGDLTIMDEDETKKRRYIGINPVLYALQAGEKRTRTSTILIRAGQDSGEILCQGPWVEYTNPVPVTKQSAWEHELIQKKESDWPSLKFALLHIARGDYGITNTTFQDGCKLLTYKERGLPYGGVDLYTHESIL